MGKTANAAKPVKAVKAKKRCCNDRPRCKRCPLVLARLERSGLAEREPGERRFVLAAELKKKQLKAART